MRQCICLILATYLRYLCIQSLMLQADHHQEVQVPAAPLGMLADVEVLDQVRHLEAEVLCEICGVELSFGYMCVCMCVLHDHLQV